MTTSIQKWGNSQGVRIPKMLLDAVKWSENEEVTITVYDGKLIIEKAKKEKESIMELFENYEEEYEVFEEEEPEINLITSLNQQERKSDKEQNNETIKEEQQDFVMEHSDIILKPSKNLTTLTDEELPSLKQKNE